MTMKKRTFALILCLTLLVGGGLMYGGMQLAILANVGSVQVSVSEYENLKDINEKYAKLEQLYLTIEANFYKDVDKDALEVGMYKGLFTGLGDVYSTYMTKDEYEAWKASALGEFEGIGITFAQDDNGDFVIINTITGSPAEKAGLMAGDFILKVDGKEFTDLETLGTAIRGDAGSKVEVTYERDDKDFTISLIRAKIVTESVIYELRKDKIGYIKITGFEDQTSEDFTAALRDLEVKGAKGLIIDLRNNGGGLVDEGVQIADLLMGKGTITYLQDRKGKKEYYDSDAQKTSLPYVVLVNDGTASTSEIVAAAIKDSDDGQLVGITTFGKGIVQATTQLPDGDAIKLTIKQYFSPLGTTIHKIGVTPDYVVNDDPSLDGDEQLNKALALLL
jgi:carboxyl-terminal processing protease